MASPTLVIFPTRDTEGRALRDMVLPLARELGFEARSEELSSQLEYVRACHDDDVVVLDATVGPKAAHNYHATYPTPLDHVLVVARSCLPLNFYGLRESAYDEREGVLTYATALYQPPFRQTNEQILAWLSLELPGLARSRPRQEKGVLGPYRGGMSRGIDALNERRAKAGQIFISFRRCDLDGVRKLKATLERPVEHDGRGKVVRYFEPGAISSEVMPEQRRWQVLSMLDRFIVPAEEIWIYGTPEYYNSWWTLGELLTLAYRRGVGTGGTPVRVYDPSTGRDAVAPDDYLPRLTTEQSRRMARWFANSDAAEMGPEALLPMLLLRELPLIGRLPYLRDHVWSRTFWQHPIVDCHHCRNLGAAGNRFDVEDVLWTRGPGFTRLSPEEMHACAARGSVACRTCARVFSLQPSQPHHLWIPALPAQRAGPELMRVYGVDPTVHHDPTLLPLPTWSLGE